MSRWVSVTHSASRDIGTQTSVGIMLGAGPQREGRERRVVARLPEPGALLRPRGPFERPAAEFLGDLAEPLGLLGHARLGAVELQEQHRRLAQRRAWNRD